MKTTREIITNSITIIVLPKQAITPHTEDRLEMTIISTVRTIGMEEATMDGKTILTTAPEKTTVAQEDPMTMIATTYLKGTMIIQPKSGDHQNRDNLRRY